MENKKILMVEDDFTLCSLYQEILGGEGFEVKICNDGEEGMLEIKKGGYDIIFLDLLLPKKSGMDILKSLNEEEKRKNGPIIILSNLGQEAIIQEAYSLGVSAYIIKTALDPAEIIKKIKEVAETQKRMDFLKASLQE